MGRVMRAPAVVAILKIFDHMSIVKIFDNVSMVKVLEDA